MAFTDKQRRALRAKLSYRHVKTRSNQGMTLSYVEGWHAIAEANRIFGYDSWDRQTQSPHCVWSEMQRGQVACFYSTKVRITVRAGATITIREGIGTGFGRSQSADMAHDIALKAAETDATKRALATFGNPFGLALYDKDQTQVTKPPQDVAEPVKPLALPAPASPALPIVLRHLDTREQRFEHVHDFVGAVLKAVPALATIEDVYTFWDANMASFASLRARVPNEASDPTQAIISTLKGRARMLGLPATREPQTASPSRGMPAKSSEPAALAIPKEKRVRDKGHLAFVAGQPCLVCGRKPAQAHHLRFAQPRAMALKVSDEYTVPLCTTHHDELHRTGDERAWWARHGIIEPLKFAARLWAASRMASPGDMDDAMALPFDAEADAKPGTPDAHGPAATS